MNTGAGQDEKRTSDLAAEIDRWFVDLFHNSPVSRATDIFNLVHLAVTDLKLRLAAILQEH